MHEERNQRAVDGVAGRNKSHHPNHTQSNLELVELGEKSAVYFDTLRKFAHHESPVIKELLTYATTLDQRIELASKTPTLDLGKANEFLECLPEETIKQGYRGVIARLKRETSYLAELSDVGVAEIISGDLETIVNGAQIRFFRDVDCPMTRAVSNRNALGAYSHDQHLVLIRGEQPSEATRWRALIIHGALPPEIATIDHELTHHAQKLDDNRDRTLTEVHAYIAQADSPTFFEPRLDERHETIRHVQRLYGDSLESKAQIILAYDHIKALKLFGLDDAEVGKIVGQDSYCPSQKQYPLLRARLLEKIDQLNLDKKTLTPTINALKARHHIELHVHRATARSIAHEELIAVTARSGGQADST